jgi:hypothetical protein
VSQDQVSVEVSGGDVVISGEITRRERAGVLRRATRRHGRFEYRTMLSADADPEPGVGRRWPMACTPCGWPRPRPGPAAAESR